MTDYIDYAEYYDLATPFWGDIPFYREYARNAGSPLLELACGTGRVLIPLAEAGFDIWGIDISENMLSVCRNQVKEKMLAERTSLVRASMTTFDLPRKDFTFAYIALRSFMHLYTQADQLDCLSRVHAHLRPGAFFVVDVYAPIMDQLSQAPQAAFVIKQEFDLPNGNHVIRRDRFVRTDWVNQIKYIEVRFEEYSRGGEPVRARNLPLNTHYLFPDQLRLLLEQTGFECLDFYRDYEKKPLDGTGEIIAVARRL